MRHILVFICCVSFSLGIPTLNNRIRGGFKCDNQQKYPYAVSLQHGYGKNFCAGALIDPQWVLTGAHCFNDAPPGTDIRILAGTLGVDDYTNDNSQVIKVQEIIIHDQYDPDSDLNDIALVKMEKPFEITNSVQIIKLAPKNHQPSGEVLAYGWGATTTLQEDDSNVLKCAKLSIVDDSNCAKVYQGYGKNQVCVVGKTPDAPCQGDSGSSLVQMINNVAHTVGVLSFGSDRCGVGPTVYTNVGQFIDFIEETMKNN